MAFERRTLTTEDVLTSPDTWNLTTLKSVASSADKTRIKGIYIKGIYWVSQATEVNTQYGSLGIALMRFPDTVATPAPEWAAAGSTSPDAGVLNPMFILTAGQNNPVLFTYKYRAINIRPGEKLYLGLYVHDESGTSINHYVNLGYQWVESDD